ncbi:MAG: ABC-type transport auxiliary lipoprotein family protein [Polyangiales bacterium]
MRLSATIVCLPAVLLAGCSFFGKSEPLDARYYSAERAFGPSASAAPVAASAVPLRLGEVSGSTHLRERIAYRTAPRELGFYDGRRWTERPEAYLRRALAHALFEQRGMQRITSGVAPTLEVELTHFEEVLAPRHAVRVQAHVLLRDHRSARFEHTFGAEQEVESGTFDAVPEALANALGRVVDEISDRVVAELQARPALVSPDPAARQPADVPALQSH